MIQCFTCRQELEVPDAPRAGHSEACPSYRREIAVLRAVLAATPARKAGAR